MLVVDHAAQPHEARREPERAHEEHRRGPTLATSRALTREVAKIARLSGRNAAPVATGLKPSTRWRYCVTRKNVENCAPTTSAMSTSAPPGRGCGRARAAAAAAVTRPLGAHEEREQERPTTNEPMVERRRPAAVGGADEAVDDGDRTERCGDRADHVEAAGTRGVSVTKRRARTSTTAPMGTLTKRVQCQLTKSVRMPPRSSPMDAPADETAVKRARPRLRAASLGALVVTRARTLGCGERGADALERAGGDEPGRVRWRARRAGSRR